MILKVAMLLYINGLKLKLARGLVFSSRTAGEVWNGSAGRSSYNLYHDQMLIKSALKKLIMYRNLLKSSIKLTFYET
jgi:hypothetical protein